MILFLVGLLGFHFSIDGMKVLMENIFANGGYFYLLIFVGLFIAA